MLSLNVIHADCRKVLRKLPNASYDFVLADPPYPSIAREYGVWTEEEWAGLIDDIMPEVRRILTPTGSAVFVLQPNSESAGRMRLWVYEFIATWGRKWNIVQDVYQWNHRQLPYGACTTKGLLRGSVKHCVWFGAPDCFRNQDAVLWQESDEQAQRRLRTRAHHKTAFTSASTFRADGQIPRSNQARIRAAAVRRGGVTPFNLIPASNTGDSKSKHPARTSPELANWWLRYACPTGGRVLDPFCGSGTTLWEAEKLRLSATGIEIDDGYAAEMRARLKANAVRKRA